MQRLEASEPTEVVLQKPHTSLFSPHCIVVALLPNQFASRIDVSRGYHAVQMDTLKWLGHTLRVFARRPDSSAGGILNADNQFQLTQEMRDSVYVALWVADIVDRAVKAPKPSCTTFHDVLVPVLCGTSFWGEEDDMIEFFKTLERTADFLPQQRRRATDFTTKHAAMRHVVEFERNELGRHARTAATQSLTRTRMAYGGAPVIAAFALAMIRQAWAELKVELYMKMSMPSHTWR